MNYYSEWDPRAAAWLRELIKNGHIPKGHVDERSITEVNPCDLAGFTQCHFFSGISGWSVALQLAGWPEDRPVWTGSCPCQPFSAAGKGLGTSDERHLWPEFLRLIVACRPPVIFGEQVASAAVIGRQVGTYETLPNLQAREEILRILRQFQRESSGDMYRMRAESGEDSQTQRPEFNSQKIQELAGHQAWARTNQRGQTPRKESRHGIQFDCRGYSAADRQWDMRAYGDTFRSDSAPGMECSVIGQDRLQEGVHAEQRESDSVRSQRDGQYLGVGENIDHCRSDYAAPSEEVKRLIGETGPSTSEAAIPIWIDGVRTDLEEAHYTFGSSDLPAAGVGAPHIRQRLYWVAESNQGQCGRITDREGCQFNGQTSGRIEGNGVVEPSGPDGRLALTDGGNAGTERQQRGREQRLEPQDGGIGSRMADNQGDGRQQRRPEPDGGNALSDGADSRMANAGCATDERWSRSSEAPRAVGTPENEARQREWSGVTTGTSVSSDSGLADSLGERGCSRDSERGHAEHALSPSHVDWQRSQWINCRDGKLRRVPVEPEFFPLAHGVPSRVGLLRGYGNAIVPQVAAQFIQAYLEAKTEITELAFLE